MEEWRQAFDKAFPKRRDEFDADHRNSWGYVKNRNFFKGTSRHCFAGMNGIGSGATHLLNGIQKLTLDAGIVFLYLDWLLNRSPYASIFLTKDAEKALEEAIEVIDAAHPANLVLGGMTASRTISEYPYILTLWFNLVKRGVHPNIAFYYSHLFRAKSINPNAISIVPAAWNHVALSATTPEDYVLNFYEGKHKSPGKLYSSTGSYNGVQNLWGHNGMPEIDRRSTARKEIENWFLSLKSKTFSSNPFAIKSGGKLDDVADNDMYTYNKNVSHIVDWDYGIDAVAEFLTTKYRKVIEECPIPSVS